MIEVLLFLSSSFGPLQSFFSSPPLLAAAMGLIIRCITKDSTIFNHGNFLILSLCFVYLPCNKLEVGWIAVLSQVVVVGNAPRICIDRATNYRVLFGC
jgi:hypothetical protein